MSSWNVLDVFAGAGGLSYGFKAAGFDVVAGVEWDADSAATYRRSHPDAKLHEEDVAGVVFAQYRGVVDVVVGGPPCQPWSIGGLRRGVEDPRDGIPQFVRAVREVAPTVFVMENVAGLARLSTSGLLQEVLDLLRTLRYTVDHRVLHAAEYGVPQARDRLVVVGVRPGITFDWPDPTHGDGRALPKPSAREVIGLEAVGEPNPSIVTYAKYPSLRPDPYHGHLWNGGGRPINLERPAPTLLASMGGNKTPWVDRLGIVPEYHTHLMRGGSPRSGLVPGARRITVTEAAALQSFPPAFVFEGKRSSQYRQVGNSVPPQLAEVVARCLAGCLA